MVEERISLKPHAYIVCANKMKRMSISYFTMDGILGLCLLSLILQFYKHVHNYIA